MAIRVSQALREAALSGDNLIAGIDLDSGAATLLLYTGNVHASFGTSPGGTLLATLTFDRPSFFADDPASITANSIVSGIAVASGDAGCFVIKDSAGTIAIDGSCSATGGGGDLQASSVSISEDDTVSISSLKIDIPQS